LKNSHRNLYKEKVHKSILNHTVGFSGWKKALVGEQMPKKRFLIFGFIEFLLSFVCQSLEEAIA